MTAVPSVKLPCMPVAQSTPAEVVVAALTGRALNAIEPWEHGWTFEFSGGVAITTQQLWRVLTEDGIAVTSEDHRQKFGLPDPVDAGRRALLALSGSVTDLDVHPVTGDLRLCFRPEGVLEFLNTSLGYEGWHLVVRKGERRTLEVVALGGGGLATWSID
jgi:hypothetical protein